jgi:hypothetical protein
MVSLGMALFSTVVAMVTAWIAFRMRNLIGGVAWAVGAACFLRATVTAARRASHRSPPY